MAKIPLRAWIGILILLLSLALLAWTFLPSGRVRLTVPLPPVEAATPTPIGMSILLAAAVLL